MDLNFKCPLCYTYFETQEELSEHFRTKHASYYDTHTTPPLLGFSGDPLAVAATPTAVVTTEPISTEDVLIEPVQIPEDGCCEYEFCDTTGVDACCGDVGCGDCNCNCDCDCVIM